MGTEVSKNRVNFGFSGSSMAWRATAKERYDRSTMTINLRDLRVLRARISCHPFHSFQLRSKAAPILLFDLCCARQTSNAER